MKPIDEKPEHALSKRFRELYKKIPEKLRKLFLQDFAKAHGLSQRTIRGKISGRSVTEWELLWVEGYNPYTRKSKVSEHNSTETVTQ